MRAQKGEAIPEGWRSTGRQADDRSGGSRWHNAPDGDAKATAYRCRNSCCGPLCLSVWLRGEFLLRDGVRRILNNFSSRSSSPFRQWLANVDDLLATIWISRVRAGERRIVGEAAERGGVTLPAGLQRSKKCRCST